MTWKIEGSELGIEDCDFTVSGDKVDEILRQMVDHLRDEHGIDMPDVDVILEGKAGDYVLGKPDPDVALIVQRLIEALDIEPLPETEEPRIPIPPVAGSTTGMP